MDIVKTEQHRIVHPYIKKKKTSRFFDKLTENVKEMKKRMMGIGKTTADEISKTTEEIKVHGKEKVEEGISEVGENHILFRTSIRIT